MLSILNRNLRFEVKVFLVFIVAFVVMTFYGAGNLSFEEARLQAIKDESELTSSVLASLEHSKKLFLQEGVPRCENSKELEKNLSATVIEVGANGEVARSWRLGGAEFDICMQKLITQYFYFRELDQAFFTIFTLDDKAEPAGN